MVKGARRGAKIFFFALGVCAAALAIALNIGWVLLNWRTGLLMVLGAVVFVLITTAIVLNTIFLIREIRRNEQHDAFLNAVTHELKTPVASMKLYLQTLQSRDVAESKRQEFYRIMLDDSDRLMGTIEQVLRAARTASTKPALNTPVDLREVARECVTVARARHHLDESAIAFADMAGAGTRVLGDVDELKAAIFNLVDNAVKYSGQNVRIEVQLAESGPAHIALRVRDNGVGLQASELKRIFKRFYRVPSGMALRVKGTGLGLFIVRSVAERHGGRAWAESEGPGLGSTFTLELPAFVNR
jgi:two-component system, OmpR family, sensor histidine kinase SenX3